VTQVIKARPTLYKGIQMRSRLEADYAAGLDRQGISWEYEPDCFAGPDGQWLPDFRAQTFVDGRHVTHLLEIKPAYQLKLGDGEGQADVTGRVDAILERMKVAWLSQPDVTLQLAFCTFGDPVPDLVIAAKIDTAWQVQARGIWCPLLWSGMGQLSTLNDFALGRSEVSLWTPPSFSPSPPADGAASRKTSTGTREAPIRRPSGYSQLSADPA
jgi:hypothetical protein